ncbi:MAG TPA: arginine deiminase-related protein [Thermoplasmata archaeon]
MIARRAIVREPGSRYSDCLSTHPLRHTIDLARARAQHVAYRKALSELGLEVIALPRDDDHPDSCFVEDTAVVQNGRALICRAAKEERRGEEKQIESLLSQYMPVKRAVAPGTVEGGDVVHLPDWLISGLTQRTNPEGVSQMGNWLQVKVDTVVAPKIMHLKSYVSYLGKGTAIVAEEYEGHHALQGLRLLRVPEDERYAANVLAVGDVLVVIEGYPKTRKMLAEAGFETVPLEIGEFPKCDAAITCLSILF